MFKVKVSKVSTNKNTYEAKLENIDTMNSLPEKGKSLTLTSSSNAFEGIVTSKVEMVEKIENEYLVHTSFSIYKIEVLKLKNLRRLSQGKILL